MSGINWLVHDDSETTEHDTYEEALEEAKDRALRDAARERTVFKAVARVTAQFAFCVEELP